MGNAAYGNAILAEVKETKVNDQINEIMESDCDRLKCIYLGIDEYSLGCIQRESIRVTVLLKAGRSSYTQKDRKRGSTERGSVGVITRRI